MIFNGRDQYLTTRRNCCCSISGQEMIGEQVFGNMVMFTSYRGCGCGRNHELVGNDCN